MKPLTLLILMATVACADMQPITGFDADKLRAIDYQQLCLDYHTLKIEGRLTPAAQSELEDMLLEKGMPKIDLQLVKENKIAIGMTQNAMYAAWGKPFDEHRTATILGVDIQHIYGNMLAGDKVRYVYSRNGKITSWQD